MHLHLDSCGSVGVSGPATTVCTVFGHAGELSHCYSLNTCISCVFGHVNVGDRGNGPFFHGFCRTCVRFYIIGDDTSTVVPEMAGAPPESAFTPAPSTSADSFVSSASVPVSAEPEFSPTEPSAAPGEPSAAPVPTPKPVPEPVPAPILVPAPEEGSPVPDAPAPPDTVLESPPADTPVEPAHIPEPPVDTLVEPVVDPAPLPPAEPAPVPEPALVPEPAPVPEPLPVDSPVMVTPEPVAVPVPALVSPMQQNHNDGDFFGDLLENVGGNILDHVGQVGGELLTNFSVHSNLSVHPAISVHLHSRLSFQRSDSTYAERERTEVSYLCPGME